jgi:hypothetical protein
MKARHLAAGAAMIVSAASASADEVPLPQTDAKRVAELRQQYMELWAHVDEVEGRQERAAARLQLRQLGISLNKQNGRAKLWEGILCKSCRARW